ncbi:hypothetical protein [Algoriphagus winogradskyi]|uniref:DUF4365 domain-containing protein n=1 Tax=Algoriphagus winogradskyi TaxID=237017 RepID=A0ABY1NVM2_9BACT|nr:hypothetical protein [Algoriphagus winogradskyi]SMP17051.1 hypothetical protein SAMN06265367_102736 [Algoriphagus winogradskyi]
MDSTIKRMQNASIGEARTKAFLIDRFWILERSVDIDGADFIVQLKLTETDILNTDIRFGRVQAKFVQDGNTPIRIKKSYFLDNHGNPRLDFSLLVNTGNSNEHKLFLLFSSDIKRIFSRGKENYVTCLAMKVLTDEFEVCNKELALLRIENSIKSADFYRNRAYIFTNLESVNPDFEGILPEYSEQIEYNEGKIPEIFKEQKLKAFESIIELEKAHDLLKRFVETIDPIEGVYLTEKLHYTFGGSVGLPEIFNKDFYYLLKNHLDIVRKLKNDGALDNYIEAPTKILDSAKKFIENESLEFTDQVNHLVTVRYNPKNFKNLEIQNKIERLDQKNFCEFRTKIPGEISISYRIGL